MARLRDCIEAALATGKISKQEADELARRIDGFEDELTLRGEVMPEAVMTEAEKAALAAQKREVALKQRQATLQAVALQRAVQRVQAHPEGIRTGIMSLLVKDITGKATWSNIENRGHAILAQLHAHFADAMEKLRTTHAGLMQDKATVRNMVRELFGDSTGDSAASGFAKLWSETAEMARVRFNQAGGDIAKREDWGLPQYHDPVRVLKVPKSEWIERIKPMLDREKMLDDMGNPMGDMQLEQMLDAAYDRITTNGLVDLKPGRIGGTKLANKHRDHRVLPFKSAEDWLAYHDDFGHADIYTTLTDHLSGMANDIAKLEVLGPNPAASYRYLRDLARSKGEQGVGMAMLDSVFDVVMGRVNAVESVNFADFMQSVRHLLVSAKLGGAFLSALSDTAFLRQTAKFNGIPATKVFRRMMKQLNPANEADRLLAVKMNLTAEAWVNRALAANRYTEVTGAGFSAKVADFTMRASFLSAWTDAGRKAFGMEFQGFIAENAGKGWRNLPKPLQRTLKRYGFTSDEWDILRQTDMLEHDGARFFSPENLVKRTDLDERTSRNLSTKVTEMILTETDFAVPTPDARVRAISTGGAKRGTFVGEAARSIFMFKSFPITVITTHLYRGAMQNGIQNKAKYLAALTVSTTVLGGIAMQSKELSRGKDPRDMTDPKFWAAAYVQGGGAGIYGDFLFADANRFGQGPVMTLAGPMAGAVDDVTKLTVGNVQQAIKGEDTRVGADIVQFLRSYTPGGSLWYTRLAYEREVLDQLQKAVDPKASSRFARIQRARKREYNQGYWWRPGKTTPTRPPDISAAAGGS